MTPPRILELAIYIGLLIGALLCSKQSFESYFYENTDYAIKREPLSIDDLPTLTICFRYINVYSYPFAMEHGKIFLIEAVAFNREPDTLFVNRSISKNLNIEPIVNKFKKMFDTHWKEQCFMINTLVTEKSQSQTIDFRSFGLEMYFMFNESLFNSMPTEIASVTLTSEENAYGWTTDNGWFGGNVGVIDLINVESNCPYTYEFKILGLTEQINFAKCSQDSYYECLAKRFENKVLNQTFGNTPTKICSPISLPFDKKIPYCENETNIGWYYQALEDLLSDQHIHCSRTCHSKEFRTELAKQVTKDYCENLIVNGFSIRYQFQLPEVNLNIRSMTPFKVVKKIISSHLE